MNLNVEECEIILYLIKGYAENLMCKNKEYADKSFELVRKITKYVVETKYMNKENKIMPIAITKDTCSGSPRIDGRRITVYNILGCLTGELNMDEICEEFNLTKEQVLEAIEWAKEYIENKFETTTVEYIKIVGDLLTFYQCNKCGNTEVSSSADYCSGCGRKIVYY